MSDHANGNGRTAAPESLRLPPQDLEAERGVLGSILLEDRVLHEVMPILKAEDFYRANHQAIYRAVLRIYERAGAVDPITLADELTLYGEYERIGGDRALGEILDAVPHAANARYYAQIVRQKSLARGLIEAAGRILEDGYAGLVPAPQLLEEAERAVFRLAEEASVGSTVPLGVAVVEADRRIDAREAGHFSGVTTGFMALDDLTDGLQDEQLVILAARPSMGKTAISLNICRHVALECRKGVLLVSLEMSRSEIGERLIASTARIEGYRLKKPRCLKDEERGERVRANLLLADAPCWIDDTPVRTIGQIAANARRCRLRHEIRLVVVDYLQLITGDGARGANRQEQVAEISRRLKELAREIKAPVLALSQLNRASEARTDKRPRMADLRESGALEQDADLVLLLHRPDYYDVNDRPNVAELIVAKNRNGDTGTIDLTFLRKIGRFENHCPVGVQGGPIDPGEPF